MQITPILLEESLTETIIEHLNKLYQMENPNVIEYNNLLNSLNYCLENIKIPMTTSSLEQIFLFLNKSIDLYLSEIR